MKYLSKLILFASLVVTMFTACDKVGSLPYYQSGNASLLTVTASSTTVAAAPADSLKTAVTFSWAFPNYATDSSTVKYILQIDSTGRNFSKAFSKTVIGAVSTSFTGKDLNAILLGFGFNIGAAYKVDVRIIGSYANNNNQLTSNTLTLQMTPYKIPPKVAPPTSGRLFLVGDATDGGWNNPVPTPTQEFGKIDSVTYAGVFNITGGNQYLVLPVNGSWTAKYAVNDNSIAGLSAGGDFGFNVGSAFNANFPAPATSGYYVITLYFQTGKFTVVPFTSSLPANLFMVGDATPGGWSNPVPVPSQQFTRLNSSQFTLTLNGLIGGNQYLFLPVNGDWSNKYAVTDNTVVGLSAGGTFGYNFSQNFPAPAASGNYKIDVDFATLKFKTTKL